MADHRHHAAIVAIGLMLLAPFTARPALADDMSDNLAPVTKALNRLGDDACRSFKLKCKRTTRKSATTKKPKARPAKATTAAHMPTVKPVATIPPPLPRQKPLGPEAVKATVKTVAPVPRSKLAEGTLTKSDITAPVPDAVPTTPLAAEKPIPPSTRVSYSDASCLASLKAGKIEFDVIAPPDGSGNCHVETPVRLHGVLTPSGVVRLPESPVLNCRFAKQFSLWLSEAGSAVILSQLNKKLVTVATGPGYVCRGRNGDVSDKLSEHAFGNAVDITTLTINDGTTIQIADAINPASPDYAVLKAMRTTACGYFSTVLGPGANAAHATHFHFDLGQHGKSGNYKICE